MHLPLRKKASALLLSFAAFSTTVFAQQQLGAPAIAHAKSAYKFAANRAITAVPVQNTGGAVPNGITGMVTTFAGNPNGSWGVADGTGSAASFNYPFGVAMDGAGNIIVADEWNHRLRSITPQGAVTTLTGSSSGFADGFLAEARFNFPTQAIADASGNLFVADKSNLRIRKITPGGTVSTLAGSGSWGSEDGIGEAASFRRPIGIAFAPDGSLFVAEENNSKIRKVSMSGEVTTLTFVTPDATEVLFNKPYALATDKSGNLYVADNGAHTIWKVNAQGVATVLAGTGVRGNTNGPAATATFDQPSGIALDDAGNIYISDPRNSVIRMIATNGTVSTFAGIMGVYGRADRDRTVATFSRPHGLVFDTDGNLVVADRENNRIRKVHNSGYSVAPALPEGLVLEPNGTISGTPTAVSAAANYTITATNKAGSSSSTITIEVVEPCSSDENNGLPITYYRDADGDGYGVATTSMEACTAPEGYVATAGDCNDNDANVNPATQWYLDADNDGFYTGSAFTGCEPPAAGYKRTGVIQGDCNDNNAAIRPGAAEICDNGVDDNCNGVVDENCSPFPGVVVSDASVYESQGVVNVRVVLSRVSPVPVKINFATVDGSAISTTAQADYKAANGTLTIRAGQLSGVIPVIINRDNRNEGPETFTLRITKPRDANINITRSSATITILNGAAPLGSVAANKREVEMESSRLGMQVGPNPSAAQFMIKLSGNSNMPIRLNIFDATNRLVEAKAGLFAGNQILLGNSYKPGVYLAEAIQGNEKIVVRLVKTSF